MDNLKSILETHTLYQLKRLCGKANKEIIPLRHYNNMSKSEIVDYMTHNDRRHHFEKMELKKREITDKRRKENRHMSKHKKKEKKFDELVNDSKVDFDPEYIERDTLDGVEPFIEGDYNYDEDLKEEVESQSPVIEKKVDNVEFNRKRKRFEEDEDLLPSKRLMNEKLDGPKEVIDEKEDIEIESNEDIEFESTDEDIEMDADNEKERKKKKLMNKINRGVDIPPVNRRRLVQRRAKKLNDLNKDEIKNHRIKNNDRADAYVKKLRLKKRKPTIA